MGKNFCPITSKWCKYCRRPAPTREATCEFSQSPAEPAAKTCPRLEAIKTTTLADLLKTVDFERVFRVLCLYWPDQESNRIGYESVFNLIKSYNPKKLTNLNDLFIVVELVIEDGDSYLNVSGVSVCNPDKYYGIEFTPWKDWVSMNITKETLTSLTKEEIVAGCLFEMTFFGFEEDEPQEKLQELKDSIEECKNQTNNK